MAFIRWSGHCAQRLMAEYREGRSHQICLANLRGAYAVPVTLRADIRERYPRRIMDGAAIDYSLAAGPPGPARSVPNSSPDARRTWVAWFMVPSEAWPRQATAVLSELLATAPVYHRVWTLVHPFHTLLTRRRGQALPAWI
ncbi:MAG: hypothetical protein C7B45_17295 [Sulfobacillus acidophilus]|uniref:Uncharacterized protein n=1 Tax=Sulfobacillus acidophilus TaxID=53633 RepID=A0A2T2WCL9_9FIRM|nr:MAG: hypothetical protein C7B45_17295 [Sulfobacillus acidophilus]